MARDQLSKIRVGLAGEHFVAGALLIRGYVASMTLKNYPDVDLFVLNPKTGKQTTVQVKSKKGGKAYYVPEKIDKLKIPFVFVYFRYSRGKELPSDIEYYIAPAQDIARISKQLRDAYIKAKPHVKKDQPRMIDIVSLAPYRDAWKHLGI